MNSRNFASEAFLDIRDSPLVGTPLTLLQNLSFWAIKSLAPTAEYAHRRKQEEDRRASDHEHGGSQYGD
jgi:hypothetical protein